MSGIQNLNAMSHLDSWFFFSPLHWINIWWSKLKIELHTRHQTPKSVPRLHCDGIQRNCKIKSVDKNVQIGSKLRGARRHETNKPQSNENKTLLYQVFLSACANQQLYNKVYMHLLTYNGFH